MEFQTHNYHFLLMALSGLLAVTLFTHTHIGKGDYRQLLEFRSGQSGQFSQCHLNNKHCRSAEGGGEFEKWGAREGDGGHCNSEKVRERVLRGGFIRRTPG